MIVTVLAFAAGIVTAFAVLTAANRRPMIGVLWFGANVVLDVVVAALSAAQGSWGLAAWNAVLAAVNAWLCRDFWNRRRRKRAAALAGAKSRARVAALVRKVREAAKPRRVLRPVPGGAR